MKAAASEARRKRWAASTRIVWPSTFVSVDSRCVGAPGRTIETMIAARSARCEISGVATTRAIDTLQHDGSRRVVRHLVTAVSSRW